MIDYKTISAPIYTKTIIQSKDILNSFRKTADKLVKNNKTGWGYSWAKYCGSWHSGSIAVDLIFGTDYFVELRQPILDAVQEYIDGVGLNPDYNISVNDSWLNATSKHGFQETHHHVPNTISGSFYISSPREYGPFFIKNPLAYPPHEEIGHFSDIQFVDLGEGDVVLFPSHLEHGVMQNPINKNRYSIAFNFIAHKKE